MNLKKIRLGIYAPAVSDSISKQAENPEGSIRNQEDLLRQVVEYKNRNCNFGDIVGVFTDTGVKKFVKKVEVGTESVKIYFIVDQDH